LRRNLLKRKFRLNETLRMGGLVLKTSPVLCWCHRRWAGLQRWEGCF